LICFAHAGAGASIFHPWAAPMAEQGVEMRAAQYPGRENRWGEPLIRSVSAMVDHWSEHWEELAGSDDVPIFFYGHSMGVLVAYELAQRLQGSGSVKVLKGLILGGRNAPHVLSKHPPIHHLSDDEFLVEVANRYGNLPTALLGDQEMKDLIIPILKADFKLVDDYRPILPGGVLACPLVILSGRDDSFTSSLELAGWDRYTAVGCVWKEIESGHFFHQQAREKTLRLVLSFLAQSRA
jgi:surfactin synthase thioesterase subunit